jgi:hypothetical protein
MVLFCHAIYLSMAFLLPSRCRADDPVREPQSNDLSVGQVPYHFLGIPLATRGFHLLPYRAPLCRNLNSYQGICLPPWASVVSTHSFR